MTVLLPKIVGIDFVRSNASAAQIFTDAGVDWWVGLDGVTKVGKRLPLPPDPTLLVLDWDAKDGAVSFRCDTLPEPGTVIIDPRFGAQRVVRAVEATVDGASVTGTLWIVPSAPDMGHVSELVDGLAALAVDATRAKWGRLYEYRVVDMAGDRIEAQAVKKSDGVPDVLPISAWAGASGYRAQLSPGSRILVGFIAGDPRQPFVAFYEPPEGDNWRPVSLELDALAGMTIGARAASVTLGLAAAAQPVARAPAIAAFAQAVADALKAAGVALAGAGTAAPAAPIITAAAVAIQTAAGTLATACPSSKVAAS